jgi:hypothetical protein
VDLDAGAVDEQPIWRILLAGQRAEYLLPNPALGPANETIVESLLRPVDIARTVGPTPAALQGMHNTTQDAAIVNAIHAAHVRRQERLDPFPLRVGKPKEIRHLTTSTSKAVNHNSSAKEIPFMGPDPSLPT